MSTIADMLALLLISLLHADTDWLSRPKSVARLEDGDILVSVKEVDARAPFKHRLEIEGAGRVRTSARSAFTYASDFERAGRLSGYITKSTYDPKTGLVDATIEAFGYASKIQVKAKAKDDAIEFELIQGPLKGLTARLDFKDVGPKKSEVVMKGGYGYDTFPIPKMFLEFGLEVVFQKMAFRLRQGAEAGTK